MLVGQHWLGFFFSFFFLNNHHGKCYRSHAAFHLPSYNALYYFPCKKARGCHRKTQTIVGLPQDLQSIYHRICQVFFWRVVEIFLTERRTNTQNLNLTAWGHTETKSFNCPFLDEHPKKQFNIVEGADQKAYRSRGTQTCHQWLVQQAPYHVLLKSAYRARSTWTPFVPTFAGWSIEVLIRPTTKATRCLDWSRSETLCLRFDPTCSFQSCDEHRSVDLKVLRQTTACHQQELKFQTHLVLLLNCYLGGTHGWTVYDMVNLSDCWDQSNPTRTQ